MECLDGSEGDIGFGVELYGGMQAFLHSSIPLVFAHPSFGRRERSINIPLSTSLRSSPLRTGERREEEE